MATFFLGVLLVTFVSVSGYDITPQIPVQTTMRGYRYMPFNGPRPDVVLGVVIDINCPDSRDGWAMLKRVQAHYGTDKFDLMIHQMPLPYHRNAFLCTQGMYVIAEEFKNTTVADGLFDYIEESMRLWSNFSTANTINMTEPQVLDMIGDMAVRTTGVDKAAFIAAIPSYRTRVRSDWKFGARNGIAVAPTYFLNGVDIGIGVNVPDYQDWIAFFDTIIET